MALSLQRSACPVRVSSRAATGFRAPRLVVRCSKQQEEKAVNGGHALVAATLTAGILMGAQLAAPQEALAARSGGRAGASSFSARRAAPAARSQVNNYSTTIVSAPPVYSPFGFGGFGFGGVSIMPVVPIPFFGGILQFMFLMLVVSFVFNVIKGAIGAASSGSKAKSQDWDDL